MSSWKWWKTDIFFLFILFLEDKNLLIFWKWPIYKSCSKMTKAKGIPFSSHIISCILCSPLNGGEHCIYSNSNACAGKGLHQQNLTRIIWVNPLIFSIVITVSWHALFFSTFISFKQTEKIFLLKNTHYSHWQKHMHTHAQRTACVS